MSRIALISDIHSNIDSLEAVFRDIDHIGTDEIYCLGDIVGYGAAPAECLELIREYCSVTVKGNHDELVTQKGDIEYGERVAAPLRLARKQLSEEQLRWLQDLPLTHQNDDFTIVHARLDHPEEFSYLQDEEDARQHFQFQEHQITFLGHTHIPLFVTEREEEIRLAVPSMSALKIEDGLRYAVNIGSVGQPRDNYPRSCYGLFDTDERLVMIRRVSYDIKKAQARIQQAGLPHSNATRLTKGQ
jgi:predicted phosphodiesterase